MPGPGKGLQRFVEEVGHGVPASKHLRALYEMWLHLGCRCHFFHIFCFFFIRHVHIKTILLNGIWPIGTRLLALVLSYILCYYFAVSEVPCRVAIRTADAVRQEVPEVAKSSLGHLARIPEKNSERDLHRLTSKFNLTLPIPLSEFRVGNQSFHYLKMSDWIRFLLERNLWHHLAGLDAPNAEKCQQSWLGFWARFRKVRPKHEVFQFPGKDLSRCCAFLLHGDEGRSVRKSAILVLAAHSILGYGIRTSSSACEKDLHRLNYKRNTWVTRYLLGVLPKGNYSNLTGEESDMEVGEANVYEALLNVIAQDLRELFETGVVSPLDGHRYFLCIVNVMGDWPFIQESGNLYRSFFNAAKHANCVSTPKGICHRCLADRPGVPWEDFESDEPAWVATQNTELPFTRRPVLLQVPHVPEDPAELFAWDLFHTWHIGAGKSFLGTAIVLLAMSSAFCGSIPDRLEEVSERFQSWCSQNRFKPHLRKLSKENLNWMTTTTYPNGAWSKGHATRALNKWFTSECRAHPAVVAEDNLLDMRCFHWKLFERPLRTWALDSSVQSKNHCFFRSLFFEILWAWCCLGIPQQQKTVFAAT